MASSVTVTLDTTGPAAPSITLDGGAVATSVRAISAAIGTSDGDTTGYQMKIWGDVDLAADADVQATEGTSNWISFAATKTITLSTVDALKTVNVRIRDDVWNESSVATDTITLDTTVPVVTVSSGPTLAKVSKITGKDQTSITWQSDTAFEAYEVQVVAAAGDAHGSGTVIGTTNGSVNTSGSAGGYPSLTGITTTIDGADLEAASPGDGAKIVKVYVQEASGSWSL